MPAGLLFRPALLLALLAVAAYGVWEIRRWATPLGLEIISPTQRKLRAWGLFFLLAALGLCLGWTYLPKPHTPRALIHYAQYIILICLSVLPLVPLALLDWRENIRHLAASRRKLFEDTLGPLVQNAGEPPGNTPA